MKCSQPDVYFLYVTSYRIYIICMGWYDAGIRERQIQWLLRICIDTKKF